MNTKYDLKNIKSITVLGLHWFDKINGNSYCASNIYIDGVYVATNQFEYGYGDFYQQKALMTLKKLGYLPDSVGSLWQVRDLGINLVTSKQTVLKKQMPKNNIGISANEYAATSRT